ncbi:hypothetical protein [Virgibacillus sp. DJP39]|uniref:hypothetical protein n=1 Tax=Virgibacillus sp. DJP39 TaxID=3409790 RepID=UPI003BB4CD01
MKNKNELKKQMEDIQQETDSSAILNDVVNSEFEQHPGQNESLVKDSSLSPAEKAVQQNTDGKTWITDDDQ